MNKKIILFSQESDHTTSEVIKWIKYFKYDSVLRINVDDLEFKVIDINILSSTVATSFGSFEIKKGDIIWFRRTPGKKIHLVDTGKSDNEFDLQLGIFNHLERESIIESLYCWLLNNCQVIANPFKSSVSKINILLIAEKMGITVPDWIICDSKKTLKKFSETHGSVVQKTFNHFNYHDNKTKESFFLYTSLINNIEEEYDENFNASFFQEYIDKKYEIRSFYWNKKLYSMAIFSQNDEKTKIDFRNYNLEKPNRRIPIELPTNYSKKLIRFFNKLDLDTCSVDILVTNDDKFIFLEINPIGQFGMVSTPCNYMIEKIIAEDLIKKVQNE